METVVDNERLIDGGLAVKRLSFHFQVLVLVHVHVPGPKGTRSDGQGFPWGDGGGSHIPYIHSVYNIKH